MTKSTELSLSNLHCGFFGPATHGFVHREPLALCVFQPRNRALAVRGLAAVPAEIELRHVTAKVLAGDVVKVANHASPQKRERAFCVVRGNCLSIRIDALIFVILA